MHERELAKQIIDRLPGYKVSNLLLFLEGIRIEELAEREGIVL